MNTFRILALTVLAAAALAGCAGLPADNVGLNLARSDYRGLEADPLTRRLAAAELRQAADALALAEAAQARRDEPARVDQLAYLARQRVALAREAGNRKAAEEAVAQAAAERDRLRLAARTREADGAVQSAASARRDATGSQQQAQAAQQQAGDAERRSAALEAQLQALKAKKTDRGMVLTLGDVLFDSGRSELKPGALHNLEPLGSFLKAHPERQARIEGHTDGTGGSAANQALSARRAEAVLAALADMGVARGQLSAQGWGETRPLADDGTSGGRQMNRRVEIVLPDAAVAVPER